jgi:hypothetical protein
MVIFHCLGGCSSSVQLPAAAPMPVYSTVSIRRTEWYSSRAWRQHSRVYSFEAEIAGILSRLFSPRVQVSMGYIVYK